MLKLILALITAVMIGVTVGAKLATKKLPEPPLDAWRNSGAL
jgi:hypothetical protein